MSSWVKTSEHLPHKNLPVLICWRRATAWGATWHFDVAKFGGKRWLEVVPEADNEEFLPPDYWREIEPPGADLETPVARGLCVKHSWGAVPGDDETHCHYCASPTPDARF